MKQRKRVELEVHHFMSVSKRDAAKARKLSLAVLRNLVDLCQVLENADDVAIMFDDILGELKSALVEKKEK